MTRQHRTATPPPGPWQDDPVDALQARLAALAAAGGAGNPALTAAVAACFRLRGDWLAIVVAPAFVRMILLPGGGELWGDIPDGQRRYVTLAGHDWRFEAARDAGLGAYQHCDLLAATGDLRGMDDALAVVRDTMKLLGHDGGPPPTRPAQASDGEPAAAGRPLGRRGFLRILGGKR